MKKRARGILPLVVALALPGLLLTADVTPQVKKKMLLRQPDLAGGITCPASAVAGQELKATIGVWVENRGNAASGEFAVDLVLSSNDSVPVKFAGYSASWHEDVLLQGGREHVAGLPAPTLATPSRIKVKLNGKNRIPADTPPGDYYLAAVFDPGQAVSERNESNNVALCRIRVTRPDMPDLRVTGFAHTGAPAGSPPECRLLVTVVNRGPAPIPLGTGARLDVYVDRVLVESIDLDSDQVEQTAFHDVHFAYDPANPGKSRSVVGTHYIFPASAAAVTYTCRGVADPANVIAELIEANNSFTRDEVIPAH